MLTYTRKDDSMSITKEYVVNENILTLYNLLNNYYNSSDNYPLEIKKKVDQLLKILIKHLEKNFLDLDIKNDLLIRKITFINQ